MVGIVPNCESTLHFYGNLYLSDRESTLLSVYIQVPLRECDIALEPNLRMPRL